MERNVTLYDEHIVQYIDDVLSSCILENYMVLLTNVTPIHSIKNKIENKNWNRTIRINPDLYHKLKAHISPPFIFYTLKTYRVSYQKKKPLKY